MSDTFHAVRRHQRTAHRNPARGRTRRSRLPPSVDRLPARCPLLTGLPDDALEALLADARMQRMGPRQEIVLANSYPGGCWLVTAGHVKEHRRVRDGNDIVTDIRGPGDLVAEAAALDRARSPVDITTIDPVTALFLETERLTRLAAADEAIASALQHAVSLRGLSAQHVLVRNGRHDLQHRVVAALLDLADRFGHDVPTGRCLGVPLSQEELASWAGMSRESFAKMLRRLRTMDLVITSRRDIVLSDVAALSALLQPRLTGAVTPDR